MNEVFGDFFRVDAAELFEPAAYAYNGIPSDVFVLDDHLHFVRSDIEVLGAMNTRARAQGATSGWPRNPSNPNDELDEVGGTWTPYHAGIIGLPIVPENFQAIQFIKDVFLDSQVHVALIPTSPPAVAWRQRERWRHPATSPRPFGPSRSTSIRR